MNISITVMQGEISLVDELNTQATTKLTAGMFFLFACCIKCYNSLLLITKKLIKSFIVQKLNFVLKNNTLKSISVNFKFVL